MSEELGISVKQEDDFSAWYLHVVRKGGFLDQRSPVKGFDVITPWGYAIWERIQNHFDMLLKKKSVQNAYFPLFIPEGLIKKEEEHFAGFKAEAFAVTEAGGVVLDERLYVRPTSETIMYYMYALWLRSYKDLPLRINQWCNVVRHDTKQTKPFIRGREFLWQECHTAHATKKDADAQVLDAVKLYRQSLQRQAIEPLLLVRPKSDTFPGAEYSVVMDCLTKDGKVVQGPGTHMLGQHFSKPFGITYQNEQGAQQHVWQTSWGMTTRMLGVIIMTHGDDKGAVLPPAVTPIQAVIVPIPYRGRDEEILQACTNAAKLLGTRIRTRLDNRDYTPGFKFNEWELKGVPLRIEIGPRDIDNREVTVVKRIDGTKQAVATADLKLTIPKMLEAIQKDMLENSAAYLKTNIRAVTTLAELANLAGFARANWCGKGECEQNVKAQSGGYEIRGTLYRKKEKPFGACLACGGKAKHVVYIAKAY